MGRAIYPVIEATEEEWTTKICGKFLADAERRVTKAVRKTGVRSLEDFWVPDEIDALELGIDEASDDEWFNPVEGIATIDAIRAYVDQNNRSFERADDLIHDLEDFRRILDRAASEGRRWRLGQSY